MKSIEIAGSKKESVITDIEIAPECEEAFYNLSIENRKGYDYKCRHAKCL